MNYDLIIIGTGPAGLTAALYAGRYKINTLVIGQIPGGTIGTASEIHNFPSYKTISGFELVKKIVDQVKALDIPITQEIVTEISKIKDLFKIKTNKKTYSCKKIILATGTQRRELGISKEKEFIGKGISYCATCDAGFYRDKIVGIIGGGNAALTAALLLAKFATKVYLIYRKEKFTKAEERTVEEVEKNKRIEIMFNAEVKELIGKEKLEKVKISNGKELELDGLFIEIGSVPNTKLLEELKLKLENGSIIVDQNQKTSIDGVIAAGDITNNPLKQIITACGNGAVAADTVHKELIK